jgi:hypothetical protein
MIPFTKKLETNFNFNAASRGQRVDLALEVDECGV